jgi:hypothetical protein
LKKAAGRRGIKNNKKKREAQASLTEICQTAGKTHVHQIPASPIRN